MEKIELVYVDAEQQVIHYSVPFHQGDRVEDAIEACGIYKDYPETEGLPVGIYSKRASPDKLLRAGDRIEFYRPLSLDPKDNRRLKAKKS